MLHSKKIKEKYFKQVIDNLKPYEIRLNDCNYKADDYIALNEIDKEGNFTGRFTVGKIRNVFEYPEYLKEGYVILTIMPRTLTISNNGFMIYGLKEVIEQ